MKFPGKRGLALLAALLTAGGCAVPRTNFDRISARVEPGGSIYTVTDLTPLRNRIGIVDRGFSDAALQNADIQPAERLEFFRRRALTQMFLRVAGLDMIGGWGASSVFRKGISADDPVPVRNRFFTLMPTDNDLGINGFLGAENRDFRRELAALPQGVGLILCGDLRASSLNRALKECGAVAEKWSAVMEFLTNVPLTQCDGVWLIAVSPSSSAGYDSLAGWRIKVELPDVDGKLFSALAMLTNAGSAQKDRIVEVSGTPGLTPVLCRRTGKAVFYNTPDAEQYFEKSPGKLVDTPRFAALTAGLPQDGVFFGYVDEHCIPKTGKENVRGSLIFAAEERGSGLLRREKDGWLWIENSSMDWNEQSMLFAVNLFGFLSDGLLPKLLGMTPEAAPQQPETENQKPPRAEQSNDCASLKLPKISAALAQYAAAHQDNYPQADGRNGWQELFAAGLLGVADLHCAGARAGEREFIYFGGWKRAKKSTLPVVIDHHHGNEFNVIFADGTIRRFQLDRAGSLQRIVSFLHTQYHWDERDFNVLMRKAIQMDSRK